MEQPYSAILAILSSNVTSAYYSSNQINNNISDNESDYYTNKKKSLSSPFLVCEDMKKKYPDLIDELRVQILLGSIYVLIWLLGVGGNSMVLYMVLWRKLDFSVRTVFIVSLSFSDLLMALTSLPVTAVSTFTRVWVLPDFLCYSIGLLQASSVFVSSFTLIMIAVDRYYLICHPHSVTITVRRAKSAVGVFWAIGVTMALPMSLFMKMENLEQMAGVCGYGCVEDWPSTFQPVGKRVYGVTVFIIQYGFPMILCPIFYWEISKRIGDQFERRQKTQVVTAETIERSTKRRRRTNRMMVFMVLSFILSWMPFNVANLVRDFDLFEKIKFPVDYFMITFAVGHLIAMTSVLWNPLIYSFFNLQFRTAVKQILAGRRGGGKNNSNVDNTRNNCTSSKPTKTTWL